MKILKKSFFVALVMAAIVAMFAINASAATLPYTRLYISDGTVFTQGKHTIQATVSSGSYSLYSLRSVIDLYDENGNCVDGWYRDSSRSLETFSASIDFSNVKPGVYVLRAYTKFQLQRNGSIYNTSKSSEGYSDTVIYIGQWKQDSTGWWLSYGSGRYFKSTTKTVNPNLDDSFAYSYPIYKFKSNGYMVTGWSYGTSGWNYYDTDGKLRTNWIKVSGKWYYLNPDNASYMQTNWKQINGKWYYFGSDGAMRTNWQKINNKWYCFTSNGDMKTGWLYSGGNWYYLDATNGDMKTGWSQIGTGNWYYFNSDGILQSGWKYINGGWYYLDPNNDCRMATGFKTIGGVDYYLDPANDSRLATNKDVTINGVRYHANSSGALTCLATKLTAANTTVNVSTTECTVEPTVTVTYNGSSVLVNGEDYTITSMTIDGDYRYVTITGKGDFCGSVTVQADVTHSYYGGSCQGCGELDPNY